LPLLLSIAFQGEKMIGQTISHYKIFAKLGGGGMGVVYKAEDIRLKRSVALKFLPFDLTRDEEAKERFVHEAQAASALDHPNICNIHEIDETEDGQLFICMAYYEGETLKKKVASGQLSVDSAIDIAMQIAQGLARAHEAGITHRDIKPANVMITTRGEVKIVDFGLAKLAGRTKLTKSGATLGTVAYMSPEQAQGVEADHRSDIWALGVVMYEMLTEQLPFSGEYDMAMMYAIVNTDPQPVRSLRSEVPVGLEQIINKALAKKPEERYQRVEELLADLKELGTAGKTPSREVVHHADAKTWLKRMAVPAGIGLLLILGFLLLRPLLFEQVLVSAPKPIAVISFENLTGDTTYNYLQKAIPNLLITSLEQSQYLQVTTWERMNDLLKQMGKENVAIVDKNLGFELCRMDGVDIIVLGSFTKAGDMFATDVKVLNVSTKAMVKSASAGGAGIASILENQIDALSKEISRGVGLSKRKIETTQAPIVEVTTSSMEAYNYFIRAREYHEKRYDVDAMRLFERSVELDSTFAMAYHHLYRIYANAGEPRKSTTALEKAKTYSKKASERERLLIEAYYIGAIEQNPEKADSILQQIVLKYPKDKRAHFELGRRYVAYKQYDKAIEEYNKVLNLDPNFALAYNNLGYIYAWMGDFTKAIESLQRYVSFYPVETNPLDSMGEVYLSMGNVDAAIANFKEKLSIKPDLLGDWKLAYCYALQENYVETMRSLEKHIAKFSQMSDVNYYMRAFYLYFQGSAKKALQDLQRVYPFTDSLGRAGMKFEAERLRGWIYFDMSEFELGKIAIKKLVNYLMKIAPKRASYHEAYYRFYIGLMKVKLGQIDSAKNHLKLIKSVLPVAEREQNERPKYHYDLLHAEILLAEASVESVFAVIQKIRPLEYPLSMGIPESFLYNLPFRDDISARAYQKLGNWDGAIAEYERLTTIDRTSRDRRLIPARFHYRLAKLYEQKGLTAKAMARYEHFLDVWKNADPDWPELNDAKTQLAKLKR
jgi:serine/threonine protein kinase/tetratricopeptide (TPR) repeat protein